MSKELIELVKELRIYAERDSDVVPSGTSINTRAADAIASQAAEIERLTALVGESKVQTDKFNAQLQQENGLLYEANRRLKAELEGEKGAAANCRADAIAAGKKLDGLLSAISALEWEKRCGFLLPYKLRYQMHRAIAIAKEQP